MDKNNGGRGLRTQEQERPSVSTSPRGRARPHDRGFWRGPPDLRGAQPDAEGSGVAKGNSLQRYRVPDSEPDPWHAKRARAGTSGRALLVRSGVVTYGGSRMRESRIPDLWRGWPAMAISTPISRLAPRRAMARCLRRRARLGYHNVAVQIEEGAAATRCAHSPAGDSKCFVPSRSR